MQGMAADLPGNNHICNLFNEENSWIWVWLKEERFKAVQELKHSNINYSHYVMFAPPLFTLFNSVLVLFHCSHIRSACFIVTGLLWVIDTCPCLYKALVKQAHVCCSVCSLCSKTLIRSSLTRAVDGPHHETQDVVWGLAAVKRSLGVYCDGTRKKRLSPEDLSWSLRW